MKTIVVFRKFKEGDVVALFPKEEYGGGLCMSYQTIGQHGGADYGYCISITKPAKESEYSALAKELKSLGYDLNIKRKARF